jgi:hypothetical protein
MLNSKTKLTYLTKENVLSALNEQHLFSYYFPLKIQIGKNIYKSPFRPDHKAGSCHFNWWKGRFLFFDKAYNQRYDVFQYIMLIQNCSLYEALYIVNKDFNLNFHYNPNHINLLDNKKLIINDAYLNKAKNDNSIRKEHIRTFYKVLTKEFSKSDLNYWDQFGINNKTLINSNIFSVDTLRSSVTNGWHLTYSSERDNDLCFVYVIDENVSNTNNDISLKIYRPYSESNKWRSSISTPNLCHGLSSLSRNYNDLYITSSFKDALVLRNLGYEACCPLSESAYIDKTIIKEFKLKYKNIFLLYDYDKAGIESARKHAQIYDVSIKTLENYYFKDPAEVVQHSSYDNLKNIMI